MQGKLNAPRESKYQSLRFNRCTIMASNVIWLSRLLKQIVCLAAICGECMQYEDHLSVSLTYPSLIVFPFACSEHQYMDPASLHKPPTTLAMESSLCCLLQAVHLGGLKGLITSH